MIRNTSQILTNDQTTALLIGSGDFYIKPMPEFDEPTDFDRVWRQYIIPYLIEADDTEKQQFSNAFLTSLIELCNYKPDVNLGIYVVFSHLKKYFYFKKEKPLIEISVNWHNLTMQIGQSVFSNRESLRLDKRWAGVEWNTTGNAEPGILGVLYDTSNKIIHRFDGPRFL